MDNQLESNYERPINKVELYEKKTFKELYLNYNKNFNKKGYFVVGWELMSRLYLNLESYGYTIPNLDQKAKHRIRPDKSIQPAFMQYLKDKYIDLSEVFEYGQVIDNQDWMEFKVIHIKNKYLIDFINFFENEWLVKTAPSYFKNRDKLALTYLPFLLDDPVFLEVDNEKSKVNNTKKMSEQELAEECKRTIIQYQLKLLAGI